MLPSRRDALLAGFAGAAALSFPRPGFAAEAGGRKLVVFILRGGMDGLAAVAPVGDPAYASARRGLVQARGSGAALDGTFALHPKLAGLAGLYASGELIVAHAVGTPYRDRSHFDAQNVLETGAAAPFVRQTGWVNAALGALPARATQGRKEIGLALAAQEPLILRGATPVATWSPSGTPDADADTVARLMDLYRHTDPQLAAALTSAQAANAVAAQAGGMNAKGRGVAPLVKAAAGFLLQPTGPVAAVIEMSGWDTHIGQIQEAGPLARALTELDAAVLTLKADLGPAWRETLVVIVTEFGRTVAMNGSGGTDHGTGMAAFLSGGAIAGGRVLADWPGLAPTALLDGRDLRPTMDVRAVLKGALSEHLGIARSALDAQVFPDSAAVRPLAGLIRA
jgi:uncharacterized protein (DUF1501 family)